MNEKQEAANFLKSTIFGKEVVNTLTAFDMYKILLSYRKEVVKNLTIPDVSECSCKDGLNHAIDRICQKCNGIIPIRHYSL